MKRACQVAMIGLIAWGFAGCLSVEAPSDVQIGHAAPPPIDRSKTPRTYDEAVHAWEQACQRNAWLEQENARLDRKYQEAKREKKEYEDKYDRLKDRYED